MSKNFSGKIKDSRTMLPGYKYQVTEDIVAVDKQKLLLIIRFDGYDFGANTDSSIESNFENFVLALNEISKSFISNLSFTTYIKKSRANFTANEKYENNFIQEMCNKYYKEFNEANFYDLKYYLAITLKYQEIENGIRDMEDIKLRILKGFSVFKPYTLTTIETKNSAYSETLSFLANLYTCTNNNKIPVLGLDNFDSFLGSLASHHFGYDILETRPAERSDSIFSILYDLNYIAPETYLGQFDFLLKIPKEFILSTTIKINSNANSLKKIDQQINKLSSFKNSGTHEIVELTEAKEFLATGELVFGDAVTTLQVFGNNPFNAITNAQEITAEFLSEGNSTSFIRSNLRSRNAFCSLFPSQSSYNLKKPRTLTTLATCFSLNNSQNGKKIGNPIGDGNFILPLKTETDNLFYFNFHPSPSNKNVMGDKYAGHTLVLGQTGSGKTALIGFFTAFLTRFNPKIFAIDYNRSMEMYLRAYGGEYFAIKKGIPTGLNPFKLEDNAVNREFLYSLIEILCRDEFGRLTITDEKDIKMAVDAVMDLNYEYRQITQCLSFIHNSDLKLRLSKWCESGRYSWCFDNYDNQFNPNDFFRIGFDTTEILNNNYTPCEPILACLFHYKNIMQKKGELMLSIVEEFWVPANFKSTQDLIKSILKAGRLKNEFVLLASQSPEDALNCDIAAAIIEQTQTKILLANTDAKESDYLKLGISSKSFNKLKRFNKNDRKFLIYQNNSVVCCTLDLYNFKAFIPIISGTTEVINLANNIIQKVGKDPDTWIPLLQKEMGLI
ncbi:MAG: hypothetical protein R3Y52_01450 [Psittacicella sp.]